MIEVDGDTLKIAGPVLMKNVCEVRSAGEAHLSLPRLTIDLAGVTEVDSTAVSLLLDWQREAAKRNASLRVINMPANLKALAELYGVLELLPGASPQSYSPNQG